MKSKIFTILMIALLVGTGAIYGQIPQGINYQAVVRNANGTIAANAAVTFRFTFLENSASGTNRYQETKALTTDSYGMANHVLGTGTAVSGSFSAVDWSKINYLKTEVNLTGNYVVIGTEKFQSVPYALNAGGGGWATSGNNIYNSNSGNVGIGTNAPTDKLHVEGANPMFKMVNSAIGSDILLLPAAQTATGGIGTGGNFDLPLFTNGLDRVTIKADGKVGIGTANPATILQVDGGDILINGLAVGRGNNSNSNCAAFGELALNANQGNTNSAFGASALKVNSSGYDNAAVGTWALIANTSGGTNTGMGVRSLETNVTGSGNTAVGHLANVSASSLNNAIAIGNYSVVNNSNKASIGNSSVSSIGGQVSWTAFSDARIKNDVQENVVGLEFIQSLRPVTYHYDVDRQNELLGLKETGNLDGKYDIEKIAFSGFLAQEVEQAAVQTGYDFSGVDKSGSLMGLRYSEFVVPLVKAVQEQQAQIEALKAEIAAMKK